MARLIAGRGSSIGNVRMAAAVLRGRATRDIDGFHLLRWNRRLACVTSSRDASFRHKSCVRPVRARSGAGDGICTSSVSSADLEADDHGAFLAETPEKSGSWTPRHQRILPSAAPFGWQDRHRSASWNVRLTPTGSRRAPIQPSTFWRVIMREREIDRFHPVEIILVQRVLGRQPCGGRDTEMRPKHAIEGIEDGQGWRGRARHGRGIRAWPATLRRRSCTRPRPGRRLRSFAHHPFKLALRSDEVVVVDSSAVTFSNFARRPRAGQHSGVSPCCLTEVGR